MSIKKEVNSPKEFSIEEANSFRDLNDILSEKEKKEKKLLDIPTLNILKKSQFYLNNKELREHIANYKGYAIMIRQEKIKEKINEKEFEMFPSLIKIEDLKDMKKVNGNIIRKINPDSIHEFEKMALIHGVIIKIDSEKI